MKHPMEYIYISYLTHEEDDPAESYVELDEAGKKALTTYQNLEYYYGTHFQY